MVVWDGARGVGVGMGGGGSGGGGVSGGEGGRIYFLFSAVGSLHIYVEKKRKKNSPGTSYLGSIHPFYLMCMTQSAMQAIYPNEIRHEDMEHN